MLTSPALKTPRRVKVYVPPIQCDSAEPYPLLVIHDGFDYLARGRMAELLDNLINDGDVPPLVVLFVPPADRTEEYAGTLADDGLPVIVLARISSRGLTAVSTSTGVRRGGVSSGHQTAATSHSIRRSSTRKHSGWLPPSPRT